MSLIAATLFALLISISALTSCRIEAKPLNQNHVKFRRLPPKEFSAALGSSITIECEAGGSPPPSIHWLKNGRRISNNNRAWAGSQLDQLLGQPGQLELPAVEINELEQRQQLSSAAGSWSALLDSLAPVVDEVNRIALSSTRSRLFIDCASLQDEAVYTCVAENAFARISSHTKLNLIKPVPLAQSGSGGAADNDLLSGALEEVAALDGLVAAATSGQSGEQQQQAQPAQQQQQVQPPQTDRNHANGQVNSKQLMSKLKSAAVAAAVQAAAAEANQQDKQKQLQEVAALAAIPQCLSERATKTGKSRFQ